ncbi:RNA polymerase sigma factor SigJ [Micromonospora sp. NPDC049559]|uniref:RNA polymerase sigma factor SigJ n=1 Tax=Micromonospora sp. NPDC049559 TaxID=3155923 RepID=UPI003413DCA4
MTDPAAEFETHRRYLTAVAYRLLGSRTEAEDVVQEVWPRFAAARPGIDDPQGWLTTVTARLCLDLLRSARVRREAYVGTWLPEPDVSRLPDQSGSTADPAELAVRRDEVSYALLVVMERLSPEQRVAFVLHDVFAVPFAEIGRLLGGTTEAARQLASRARRTVTDQGASPSQRPDPAEQRRLVAAFVQAAQGGDLAALLAVLAPDVSATGDGGGVFPAGRRPVVGAQQVARLVLGLFRQVHRRAIRLAIEPVLVNGDPGLLVDVVTGAATIRVSMAFASAGGRITRIYDQLDPAKLTNLPPMTASPR